MKENANDKRNVIYSSQSFFNLAYMASISEDLAISTSQHYEIIKDVVGIKKLELPFEMNDANVFCSWHRSFSKDKGLIWFKEIIKEILTELK